MKMMEEVEKLCDRLELTRYESVLAKGPPSPKGVMLFVFLLDFEETNWIQVSTMR